METVSKRRGIRWRDYLPSVDIDLAANEGVASPADGEAGLDEDVLTKLAEDVLGGLHPACIHGRQGVLLEEGGVVQLVPMVLESILELDQARRVLDVESATKLVWINASACWIFIAEYTYGMPLTIRSYSSHDGGATWAVMSSAMTERFFEAAMVAMIF